MKCSSCGEPLWGPEVEICGWCIALQPGTHVILLSDEYCEPGTEGVVIAVEYTPAGKPTQFEVSTDKGNYWMPVELWGGDVTC